MSLHELNFSRVISNFSSRSIAILMAAAAAAGGENYKENGKKEQTISIFLFLLYLIKSFQCCIPHISQRHLMCRSHQKIVTLYYTPSAIIKIVDYFTNDYIYSLKASGYIIYTFFFFFVSPVYFFLLYIIRRVYTYKYRNPHQPEQNTQQVTGW
jgi:hypothetical protein